MNNVSVKSKQLINKFSLTIQSSVRYPPEQIMLERSKRKETKFLFK